MQANKNIMPWLACLIGAGFFFFQFFQLNMINVLGAEFDAQYQVVNFNVYLLSVAYLYGVAVLFIPVGILLDRYSLRYMMLIALFVDIVALLLMALISSYWLAVVLRFIAGGVHCISFLAMLRIAQYYFDEKKLAGVIGSMIAIGLLGGIVAQSPLLLLSQHLSLSGILIIIAVFGLVLFSAVYCFIHIGKINQQQPSLRQLIQQLKQVVKHKINWQLGIFTALTNAPAFIWGAIAGQIYLTQIKHMPAEQASVATSLLFFGTIIGSFFVGWFVDFFQSQKKIMLAGVCLALLASLFVVALPLPIAAIFVLFFLIGVFISVQVLSYPLILKMNPNQQTGIASGFANSLIMGGGAVLQVVFGLAHISGTGFYLQLATLVAIVLPLLVSIILTLRLRL